MPVNYRFQNSSKFALLTINDVYVDLPTTEFRLPDGTWVMPGLPISDLGRWNEQIGSIRGHRIGGANLVLFVEEPSSNPELVDAVHAQLENDLTRLFYVLHLRRGIENVGGADLLSGSAIEGAPVIRRMSEMPVFYQSRGYQREPITLDWIEDSLTLRAALVAMESDPTQFRRFIRGLNTLINGLQQGPGQDRLHQFVRSLEALILPSAGNTKNQFVHRCQTFERASDDARDMLKEAFDMRSDTEHLHEWTRAVQAYPSDQQENVCWRRTRQMERLACYAYARILREPSLQAIFRTEADIEAFWNLPQDQQRTRWGAPANTAREPLIERYDDLGRARPAP